MALLICSVEMTTLLIATGFLFMFLFKLRSKIMKGKGAPTLPPMPAGWLPVVGHMHLLSSKSQVLKETFSRWHEEYGPVLMLQLGFRRMLVVSSWQMAKECFTTNDLTFSNRPLCAAAKHLADDGYMFPFAPYGEHWREMRKIAVEEMLSNRRIRSFADVRTSEINAQVSEAYRLWLANEQQPVKVDMRKLLEELTFNVVARTVAGKDYAIGRGGDDNKARAFAHHSREAVRLFTVFVASDFFPFLEVLDIKGWIRTMKRVAGELDEFLGRCVEEHRQRRKSTSDYNGHDFIDVLLSHFKEDEGANRAIKSGVTSMMTAGNDSTAAAMIRTIYLLLLHPNAMKKVQEELDHHVGKERTVNESDLKNLVYLQAVIKESLRLGPPTPLLALRESIENCHVGGFHVPAGTHLAVNLWEIHHDPQLWAEPDKFQPERFIGSNVDVHGKHFQFIPFGSGRRICPGISFALSIIHIVLARLFQGFDLQLLLADSFFDDDNPLGTRTVLNVLLAPRLPQALYG
ncbi:Cytochrome P450 82C4 [Nymphaea thermarum]|nr:Cytochrome P450 82C4 [Nymphaea thermarum]